MIRKIPIKHKEQRCVVCEKETFIFSHHRCKACAQKQDAEKKKKEESVKELKEEKPKVTKEIKKSRKVKNKALETYFEKHIQTLYGFKASEESGMIIPFPTKANICHLFPKRNHKSVASNEMNCIYLTWDEHARLDNMYLDKHDFKGLEKAFPSSHKLIIQRMRIVRADITERTNFVEAFDKYNETLDY